MPGRPQTESFQLVYGEHWAGEYADEAVARSAEAYLRNRKSANPFFLTVGFLQPHDICYWIVQNNPMQWHVDFADRVTDTQMHDLTAYLWSLKS